MSDTTTSVHVYDLPDSILFEGLTGRQNDIQNWFKKAKESEREILILRGMEYWRKRGYPFQLPDDGFLRAHHERLNALNITKLLEKGDELRNIAVGVRVPNMFHPHRLSVKCGNFKTVMGAWNTDDDLRRFVTKAFEITGNADASTMRSIASTSHTQTVSNFLPATAKFIYETFSKPGDTILDPSAGYGGRAMGLMSTHQRNYWGIDPTADTIAGNCKLVSSYERLGLVTSRLQFIRGCAEDVMPMFRDQMFNLIFTSPPYFDIEKYDPTDPFQSSNKFNGYDLWLNGFLRKILQEARRIIKPNGWVCINIANVRDHDTEGDTVRVARESGLNLRHLIKMRQAMRAYLRKKQGENEYRLEPIFCFQRDEDYKGNLTPLSDESRTVKEGLSLF